MRESPAPEPCRKAAAGRTRRRGSAPGSPRPSRLPATGSGVMLRHSQGSTVAVLGVEPAGSVALGEWAGCARPGAADRHDGAPVGGGPEQGAAAAPAQKSSTSSSPIGSSGRSNSSRGGAAAHRAAVTPVALRQVAEASDTAPGTRARRCPIGPVAVLGDDDARPARVTSLVLRLVVLLAEDEADDVRVLLEVSRLAKVGEHRLLVGPLLGRTRELGERRAPGRPARRPEASARARSNRPARRGSSADRPRA